MADGVSAIAVRAAEIAWGDVTDERVRQIAEEGFDDVHDDAFEHGELAMAAASYAMSAGLDVFPDRLNPMALWPFAPSEFNLKNPRADLVRACALCLAEIERLDRAALSLPGAPNDDARLA